MTPSEAHGQRADGVADRSERTTELAIGRTAQYDDGRATVARLEAALEAAEAVASMSMARARAAARDVATLSTTNADLETRLKAAERERDAWVIAASPSRREAISLGRITSTHLTSE